MGLQEPQAQGCLSPYALHLVARGLLALGGLWVDSYHTSYCGHQDLPGSSGSLMEWAFCPRKHFVGSKDQRGP